MDELIEFTEAMKVLLDLANDVKERYKDNLARAGKPTHHDTLRNSIETEVTFDGKSYSVKLELQDYWKYVENGTRPHWMPKGIISKWIVIKPIIPRPDANGKIPSLKSLDYLIRRKIALEGTKGTKALQEAKMSVVDWYQDRIKAALGHDVENYIRKVTADTFRK